MTVRLFKLLMCVAALTVFAVDGISQWYVYYERGLEELDKGEWSKAANSFNEALKRKPKPELNANTYALNYIDYLPYYQLGYALFFLGDYAGAKTNFDQELSHGVITRLHHYKTLQRLREIAQMLQTQRGEATRSDMAEKTMTAWRGLLKASYQLGHGVEKESGEIDTLLSQLKIDEESRKQIAQWFSQLPIGESAALRERSAGQTNVASDSVSILREAAITAYLQGRYREALNLFNRLGKIAPDEPMLADWQQRLHFELAGLNQPTVEPFAKTDTVMQSAAPMIIIREPESEVSRFRSAQVQLKGIANDDLGIAAIEFVVNGEPWRFIDGSKQIAPIKSADGTFPFQAEFPLRMGENQISVIAYDLDTPQHSRTMHRRVIRQPPLYQTTSFWLVVGSGFLVVVGAVVGNRLIKYRITFINRYNPYIAGAPIRNEEMFFGRRQLLERILRTLPNNSLMVYGPRRIGKTSVQYQLQRLLKARQDPDYHFVPVFIDLQGIAEEVFFAHIIEELREQLGREVAATVPAPGDRQKYSHREFAHDLRNVIHTLQNNLAKQSRSSANKKIRLVFLIDEVDELNRYSERTNQRLRAIFMKSFSENLVAVLTGSNIRKEWESESSPWYNFFEQIPMPMLTREEAMQLIHAPVKGFFKFESEAASKIWETSQGKPFVIQKFCVRLVNMAIERRRRKITVAEVDSIRQEVLQDTSGETQQITAIW
jgi:tetratricopeptide (TPR) repeat protein